jgi:hypothetical protein
VNSGKRLFTSTIKSSCAYERQRYSCRITGRRDLLILISPLYFTKPSFLTLCMNELTRGRVVPTISAKIS